MLKIGIGMAYVETAYANGTKYSRVRDRLLKAGVVRLRFIKYNETTDRIFCLSEFCPRAGSDSFEKSLQKPYFRSDCAANAGRAPVQGRSPCCEYISLNQRSRMELVSKDTRIFLCRSGYRRHTFSRNIVAWFRDTTQNYVRCIVVGAITIIWEAIQ